MGRSHLFLSHKRKLIHQLSSRGAPDPANRGITETLSAVPTPSPSWCCRENDAAATGLVLLQVKRGIRSGLLLTSFLSSPVKTRTPKPSPLLLCTGGIPGEREEEEGETAFSHSRIFHITGFSFFSSVLLIHPRSSYPFNHRLKTQGGGKRGRNCI